MTMIPFNPDIHQCLKWQQNKAPGIQGVIDSKAKWYFTNHDQFWANWEKFIFDLRTANAFGLMIWCIILGVPSEQFGLYPPDFSFAYGKERQNYVYSESNPALPHPNIPGGNFYGGGSGSILNYDEIRKLLQLRYVALVSNGGMLFINYMLRFIFNNDEPWDTAGGKYFYVMDSTGVVNPTAGAFLVEYRIGPNMGLSSQTINVLNDESMGILPRQGGCKTIAIQE